MLELPAGPEGKGTLSFTKCWGIAAKSKYKDQAIDFVEAMTTADQQLAFAKAFGVMPSRQSAQATSTPQAFPDDAAFVAGAEYAQGPVNAPRWTASWPTSTPASRSWPTGDPKAILQRCEKNAEAALGG